MDKRTAQILKVLRLASTRGYLSAETPAVIGHDLTWMQRQLARARAIFPENSLHTVAIKANPALRLLKLIVKAGYGLEAASREEAMMAAAAGCRPDRIVFNSPVKTLPDLREAVARGWIINANSFEELDRVEKARQRRRQRPRCGLRVNPLVGDGSIAATSVSGRGSKFGEWIEGNEAKIIASFRRYDFLESIHVHVGSQAYTVAGLVSGIKRAFELAELCNGTLGGRIRYFDLGGGLPVDYRSPRADAPFEEFRKRLKRAVPGLFETDLQLITEFGRGIHAGAGWAASRVEYARRRPSGRIAYIHLGADFLLRRIYRPEEWYQRVTVLDRAFSPKRAPAREKWTIAGPLCFGGDIIARDLLLPPIEPGDHILLENTGAYTLGLWSRHCSRGIPAVLGYEHGSPPRLQVLRRAETAEDLIKFWDF